MKFPPFVHSFPAPAVLIGCGTIEHPNIITCSWFGTVCSEPPMVSVSVRKPRFSYHLIHETREFTANLPFRSQIDIIEYCGTKSGRDVDKFKELGLTAAPCPPLEHAPMIAECFLVLACKVTQTLELGSHDVFIAEVVSIHGDVKSILPNGRPDPRPSEQVVYLNGKYWSLTDIQDRVYPK